MIASVCTRVVEDLVSFIWSVQEGTYPGINAMHHIIHDEIDVLRGWENFEHARRRLGFLRFSRY
jgi:hypothetical protein